MRRLALLLALAPLAVAGCKKDKEPEASAGPPPIQVTIAPAKRTGDTATLEVTVKNNSEAAFQVTGSSIGFTD